MYILTIVEMKSIIVFVHPVINTNAIDMHLFAFENTAAMISACFKKSMAHQQVVALMKNEQMWAVKISTNTSLAWSGIISFAIIECCTVAINCASSFNRNIFRIHGIYKNNIAITRRHAF